MNLLAKTQIKKSSLAVLALLPLGACTSMAPGMHFDPARMPETTTAKVAPEIREITPQLIQAEQRTRAQATDPDLLRLIATPGPYRIGSGDVLSISVWGHPEFSSGLGSGAAIAQGTQGASGNTSTPAGSSTMSPTSGSAFIVHRGGQIELPLIGAVKVGGLTQTQAENLVTAKLARVFRHPDVLLQVQAYRSKRVYVGGEVRNPGIQVIDDIPMSLTEALNRAGGITPLGDRSRVEIERNNQNYTVDIPQLVQKRIDPSRILLAGGDIVHVAPRDESKVFVLGEVNHPLSMPMHDGSLSLNEALGEAGGLDARSADGRQVYVVRNAANAHPVLYHLNAQSPVALAMAENFRLKPKDVVYVDAGRLVSWNRISSLILPLSSAALATGYGVSQLK